MRVLVVEDSERLRRSLTTALKKSGYAVDATGDGPEGLWLAETNGYDTIVLDIMLPGLSGLDILHKLRKKGGKTHVLLLTAKDTVEDKVRGLQSGADDYLIKPFALEELLARVQALCRRSYGQKSNTLTVADLTIDTAAQSVTCGTASLELTAREYALLEHLALRRGQVVTRAQIEEHIYGGEVDPTSNVVDSAICILRRKLSEHGSSDLIQTRRGVGYVLGP